MSNHTPGPWQFVEEPYDGGAAYTNNGSGNLWRITANRVSFMGGVSLMGDSTYYPWVPNNRADWQLIAAAPELLEGAKHLLECPGGPTCGGCQAAKAAITKAEGENV